MDLTTTNVLLGIMAAASVVELVALLAAAIFGYRTYGRITRLVEGLEQRQVAPAMLRINAILDDVRGVTATVNEEAGRVDRAIRGTLGRVDGAAERARSTLRLGASRARGVGRGVRVGLETLLRGRQRGPAPVPGEP